MCTRQYARGEHAGYDRFPPEIPRLFAGDKQGYGIEANDRNYEKSSFGKCQQQSGAEDAKPTASATFRVTDIVRPKRRTRRLQRGLGWTLRPTRIGQDKVRKKIWRDDKQLFGRARLAR